MSGVGGIQAGLNLSVLGAVSRSRGSREGSDAEEARESPAQERVEHAVQQGPSSPRKGAMIDLMA